MLIAWQYLDKKAAAVEALKDYSSMQYIIEHSDEDIYEIETRMTSPHSAVNVNIIFNKFANITFNTFD